MAPLQWRLPALPLLAPAVLGFICSQDWFPCQPQATPGQGQWVFCFPPTQNPTQRQTMWMINKCLLNDTSFRSERQDPLFSHGGRGKGKKRGKQDLLKRSKCKDLLVGHAGDGLSAQSGSPAWPRDLSRPAGPREQSADRSPNTPRLG